MTEMEKLFDEAVEQQRRDIEFWKRDRNFWKEQCEVAEARLAKCACGEGHPAAAASETELEEGSE